MDFDPFLGEGLLFYSIGQTLLHNQEDMEHHDKQYGVSFLPSNN